MNIWMKKYWVGKTSHIELFSIILFMYNLRTHKTTNLFLGVADCKAYKFFPSLLVQPPAR